MIEYTCKRDGEVYCILDTNKMLVFDVMKRPLFFSGESVENVKSEIEANRKITPNKINPYLASHFACKKSDLKLPEEKPINDGWLSYFDADKPEVQALIGKEVEATWTPSLQNSIIETSLVKIGENDYCGRYVCRDDEGEKIHVSSFAFIRPIQQKPLKPVDESCLFKPVLAIDKPKSWEGILIGQSEIYCLLVREKHKSTSGFGFEVITKIEKQYVERIKGYKYGDE